MTHVSAYRFSSALPVPHFNTSDEVYGNGNMTEMEV